MSHLKRVASEGVKPSQSLISYGDFPDQDYRRALLDACAETLEEIFNNRSDQCLYFAMLVQYGLMLKGIESEVYIGNASYEMKQRHCKSFSWDHAWVVIGDDVVDGNVDSCTLNSKIPSYVRPVPYWGPIDLLPTYRKLKPYGRVDEFPELLLNLESEFKICMGILRKKLCHCNSAIIDEGL